MTGFSKVGEKLQQKAISIAPKLDIDTKKLNPSKTSTVKKEMSNAIVIKTNEKSKQTPWENIPKHDVYYWAEAIIPKFEWFHKCSYFDHTHYSIWFGTPSYKWECIDYEEWVRRLRLEIAWRVNVVLKDYPNLEPHQQWALVSLKYNCNSCYARVGKTVEKWDFNRSNAIVNKFPWLAKRARAEWDLFNLWVVY